MADSLFWMTLGMSDYTNLKAHSQVWDNFRQLKAFKNDEKCFLFHLKSLFRSQDI